MQRSHSNGGISKLVLPQLSADQGVYIGAESATLPMYNTDDYDPQPIPNREGRYIDQLGRVTTFTIDANGYIDSLVDPTGQMSEYDRTADGLVEEMRLYDHEGGTLLNQTSFTYSTDEKLNLERIDYFDGSFESWTYNATYSLADSHTDELGRVTLYTIEGGLVTAVRIVVGEVDTELNEEQDDLLTTFVYTTDGLVEQVIETVWDPVTDTSHTITTTYSYTPIGRWLEKITFADGSAVESEINVLAFDDFGNPTAVAEDVANEIQRVTRYFYDDAGRMIRVVMPDPDGEGPLWHPTIEYVYCKCGKMVEMIETSVEDPDDEELNYHTSKVRTRYTYDDGDLITLTRDYEGPNESFTEYEYDLAHNLVKIVDPLERETTFEYDLLNRPLRVTAPDPDGEEDPLLAPVVYVAYDVVGRTLGERDPLGNLTRYQYDTRHRLTDVFAPLAAHTQYVYNAASQLIGAVDAAGRLTQYGYDDAGRLTRLYLPGQGKTPVAFTYDTGSNLRLVTDQLGRTTEYQYDDQYRLVEEILPAPDPGAPTDRPQTSYTYFDDGQIESVTVISAYESSTPVTRTTEYAYDFAGRLQSIILPEYNAANPTWTYSYDTLGNVAKVTDPGGNRTEYEYDRLHRVTKVIGEHPDNNEATGETGRPVTQYVYDDAGQLLEMIVKATDSTTRTTSYLYDNLGRLIRSVSPDPSSGEGIYDGGVPGEPDSDTPYMDYTYDAAGRMLTAKDRDGNGTTYAYDALGRRVSETNANSHTTGFSYDLVGNLLSLTDANNNVTSWAYDTLDRVTSESITYASTTYSRVYEYDVVGNLKRKTDRNERVTEYEYDGLDRMVEENWKDALDEVFHTIGYDYNLLGELTHAEEEDSSQYDYVYDSHGRVETSTTVLEGLADAITFTQGFNISGQRESLKADIGATADFENTYIYDNLGRLKELTQQSQSGGNAVAEKRVDFGYLLDGRFDTITRYADLGGTKLVAESSYGYDGVGRLTGLSHVRDLLTFAGYGFGWDAANRLYSFTNSVHTDEDATFEYDHAGQLTSADRDGSWNDEGYMYDDNGNRVEAVVPGPGPNELIGGIWYFDAGSGTTLEDVSGHENTGELHGSAIWSSDKPWAWVGGYSLSFDTGYSTSQEATIGGLGSGEFTLSLFFKTDDVDTGLRLYGDGLVELYVVGGRLIGMVQNTSFEDETVEVVTNDALANNTWYHAFLRYSGSTVTVAYYNLSSSNSNSDPFSYSNKELSTVGVGVLAGNSNWLNLSGPDVKIADVMIFHAAINDEIIDEIRAASFHTLEYTTIENNRLQTDGRYNYLYDAEGNLATRHNILDDSYRVFVWDHRNRLIEVLDYDSENTLLESVAYVYDPFNRRIAKHFDGDDLSDWDEFYIYDGTDIVLDFVDADGGSGASPELAKRYLWGPAEDQLLAQENYDAGQDQTARLLWGLADHLGSPRDYVEFIPGDELLETEDETVLIVHFALDSFGNILSGDATEVRYIYTAQEYDAETGFYYYDRRYVDPSIGRFISEDFIWDGYNKHAYVGNAPTMFVDPSGLAPAGHHVVPQELWPQFGFDPNVAKEIFDAEDARKFPDAVNGKSLGHNFTAHGSVEGYTAHVKVELHNQLCDFMDRNGITDGKLSIEQQKQFAKEFVDHKNYKTTNKFIRGFNDSVKGGIAGVTEWWEKKGGKDLPKPVFPKTFRRITGVAEAVGQAGGSAFKKFASKAKGPLPFVLGVPFSIYCFPENARAKGFGRALADEALDTIPIVEWIKPGTEIATGTDWVPKPGEEGFFEPSGGGYRPYRPPTDRADPQPWGYGPKY